MSTFFELQARAIVGNNNKLLKLETIIDWESLRPFVKRARGVGGQIPYDEVAMLKALILQAWHNLSDHELEEALTTRLDFILFCGFERNEGVVPDETTFCRFRNFLTSKGLLSELLTKINQQLSKKGLKLQASAGALIDATIIDSGARPNKNIEHDEQLGTFVAHSADPDATYTIKRNVPRLGYKCFARCDEEGYIEKTTALPANQAEINNMAPLLEGMPQGQRLYADKGFDSRANRLLLKQQGLKDAIQRRATRYKTLTKTETKRNELIGKTRFRIEQVFGTMKRKFRFTRAAYFTTAKVHTQFSLKAICINFLKAINKSSSASPPLLLN